MTGQILILDMAFCLIIAEDTVRDTSGYKVVLFPHGTVFYNIEMLQVHKYICFQCQFNSKTPIHSPHCGIFRSNLHFVIMPVLFLLVSYPLCQQTTNQPNALTSLTTVDLDKTQY